MTAAPAETELAHLRKTLLGLACDAEVVLDLHCDCESVLHLYTGTPLWPQTEPLARCLGAQATLLGHRIRRQPVRRGLLANLVAARRALQGPAPGGDGLPRCDGGIAWRGRGEPPAGQSAMRDALLDFLQHRGVVAGEAPALPPLLQPATPLAGSEADHHVGKRCAGVPAPAGRLDRRWRRCWPRWWTR